MTQQDADARPLGVFTILCTPWLQANTLGMHYSHREGGCKQQAMNFPVVFGADPTQGASRLQLQG